MFLLYRFLTHGFSLTKHEVLMFMFTCNLPAVQRASLVLIGNLPTNYCHLNTLIQQN